MSKEDELTIHITIEWEEDEDDYQPTVIDQAAYNFVNTLQYYVIGAFFLFIIGGIMSLFS